MSGFEYAFVNEVLQEYLCPICHCPMREPVQTKCGHRFCKHCLEQYMKEYVNLKSECPIDRCTLDEPSAKNIYPDLAIQRTILDFVIKCPNEHNGCKWTGELRSVETHEPSCSFVGVKCTNEDCEATPLRKDLHNHVTNKCPKRKVECFHCKTFFKWYMKEGHFDVCTKYPMACLQRCGEHKIPRDKMNEHIENSCPHTKVECTFVHIGCKAKVQRRAISDHVKKYSEFHLKLACERLQELQVSSTLTAASIQEVQTETATAMKKIKELSEAVLKSEGLQDLSDRVAERKEKLQEPQSREDASDRLSSLQDDVFSIKKEVKELSRNVSVNAKLLELQDEINNLQKLIPRVNKENSANLQVLRKEVAGTNTKLQKLNEELNEAIIRMEERNFDANSCSLVIKWAEKN
ncbi:TNF receptor-associated factor 4-like [Oculina patagonica]